MGKALACVRRHDDGTDTVWIRSQPGVHCLAEASPCAAARALCRSLKVQSAPAQYPESCVRDHLQDAAVHCI